MSLCECNLRIQKTIISYNHGVYGIEYGIGDCFTDLIIFFVTSDTGEILLPGELFCPYHLQEKYYRKKYFSVIFQ